MLRANTVDAITITYCKRSGYAASAVNAAVALHMQLGLKAELIPGRGGIFEVAFRGKIVASKSKNGFPDDEEIVSAIATAMRHLEKVAEHA